MPKDTSTEDPEAYMKYYPGSESKVSEATKSAIRKDKHLQAHWRAAYAAATARTRAENYLEWPFEIPREVMDLILRDVGLGVREHLALAGMCLDNLKGLQVWVDTFMQSHLRCPAQIVP